MNLFNLHNNPKEGGGISYCPHFREQEVETQRCRVTFPSHQHLTLCAQSTHSSAERYAQALCSIHFTAEQATVTLLPSLAILLFHLFLLLFYFLLTSWLLGYQPITSCLGQPFTSLSSGPGFLKKIIQKPPPQRHMPKCLDLNIALEGN